MTKIERGLGKGLSALIGTKTLTTNSENQNNIVYINIENIVPNPDQPRKIFSPEKLDELIESIRQKGVLQPLLVRPLQGNRYQIIAGERRWRASKSLGIKELPTIVKDLSDKQVVEIALIENIQRDNLAPIEEAQSYQKLIKEFGYTQEEMAKEVSVSRSHVANLLRVLTLPEKVLKMIENDQISLGHAKLLIGHSDPYPLALTCYENEWSVRSLEKALKTSSNPGNPTSMKRDKSTSNYASRDERMHENKHSSVKNNVEKNYELIVLEESLAKKLKMKIEITGGDNGGKLVLNYKNLEDLDLLLKKLYSINRD